MKGLIKPCNKTLEIFKDIRFILNGYIDVVNENKLSSRSMLYIERLLIQMDKIELEIKNIMAVRSLKKKVNALVDNCILNIRVFYCSLKDFINFDKIIWSFKKLN